MDADSPPCAEVWNAPDRGNPILPGYNADPSLLQHDGKAYLYITLDPWGGRTLGCWESSDFKHWTYRELNWPTKEACTSPTSNGSMVWAPSVVRAPDGRFFMYVSVGSEVWVGTAEHPLGPWRDALGGRPLIPGNYKPGYHMIDAEAFVDEDGAVYLYWGSGLKWINGRCFVVKLKPGLVSFDGEPRDVTPVGGHYFEAPFLVKRGGKYYLTYSDGKTITDTYCVYYAVGDSPFGPFTEPPGGPILATETSRDIVSPGHHAIIRHDNRDYILYHRHRVPYLPGTAYRQVCMDPLQFTAAEGMARVAPTHRGPNLAARAGSLSAFATATASSSLDGVHPPAAVLDNNHATRWAAAPDARGAWLQLDLGAPTAVTRQELRFEYAWKSYACILEASLDGQAWHKVADYRTMPATGSPVVVDADVSARFLRLVFPEAVPGAEISLYGWEVY